MGTEQATEHSLEALRERLDTDAVRFVDSLNDDIATVVEAADELHFDYLVGDVSDCGVSSSNHTHFDLVHEDSTIHCVLFGFRRSTVNVDLDDGMQVAIKGDLSYYEDGGSISVIVEDVVEIGDGVYAQTYEENRQILDDAGLLDPDTKQSLPDRPTHVGIATSAESDAREDAVTSIHGRYSDVDITVHNTSVQGSEAMASMMEAISVLDDDPAIDVIVLTRGGGSDKHLRVFNETPLCRVIHGTDTPIVVGVGHENDRALADEVADRRVMTPTHVGEIVPRKDDLIEELDELDSRLDSAYKKRVQSALETKGERLQRAYDQHVESELTRLSSGLEHAFETHAREELTSLENRLDSAHEKHAQEVAHKEETEQYRRQRRRLVIALVVLGLLVIGLAVFILLTL